jgi:hypothetical protein
MPHQTALQIYFFFKDITYLQKIFAFFFQAGFELHFNVPKNNLVIQINALIFEKHI